MGNENICIDKNKKIKCVINYGCSWGSYSLASSQASSSSRWTTTGVVEYGARHGNSTVAHSCESSQAELAAAHAPCLLFSLFNFLP